MKMKSIRKKTPVMKAYAKAPKHMMDMPKGGDMATGADAEMRRLMQNKGIPRGKVSAS